jgi:hypothetical protein
MIGVNCCCVVSDEIQLNEGEKLIVIWLVNEVLFFSILVFDQRERRRGVNRMMIVYQLPFN